MGVIQTSRPSGVSTLDALAAFQLSTSHILRSRLGPVFLFGARRGMERNILKPPSNQVICCYLSEVFFEAKHCKNSCRWYLGVTAQDRLAQPC